MTHDEKLTMKHFGALASQLAALALLVRSMSKGELSKLATEISVNAMHLATLHGVPLPQSLQGPLDGKLH